MKKLKKSTISLAIAISMGLIAIVICTYIATYPSLSSRLTSTIKEYATIPDIFTIDKLIRTHEDSYTNPNGDGSMQGTYQLTEPDIAKLLQISNPLTCPTGVKCTIHQKLTNPNGYCVSGARQDRDIAFTLCINPTNNQVEWSYLFY